MAKTRSKIQQDKKKKQNIFLSDCLSGRQWNPHRAEKQIAAQASAVSDMADFKLSHSDL